jgi:hypothetical protein
MEPVACPATAALRLVGSCQGSDEGGRVARPARLQGRGLADLRPWMSRSTRSNRPLEGRYPYLWRDAKVEKVRDGGRVVRKGARARLRGTRVRLPGGDRARRRRGRHGSILALVPARPARVRPDRPQRSRQSPMTSTSQDLTFGTSEHEGSVEEQPHGTANVRRR